MTTYLSLWKGTIRVHDKADPCRPQPGNARLMEILRGVCREYGVPAEQLRSRCREPWLVDVRQEAAYRMHAEGASTGRIGTMLERDHTSVMNLLRRRERVAS